MKKFAVIGHPVEHSLSPKMFSAAFKKMGLKDYSYGREDVLTENLGSMIDKIRKGEFQGFSVTVPHKKDVMKFLDEVTKEAREIGAVNTVYVSGGKIVGNNTDWIGFKKALMEKVDLKGKKILLYGAGGAARACVYALKDFKKNVFITNRTTEKGIELAKEFGMNFVSTDSLPQVDVLINATSIGLDDANKLLVPEDFLKKAKVVFDLLYGDTLLSNTAKKLGLTVVDGKKMLLYQAIEQFKFFTDLDAPVEEMSKSLGL